MPSDGWEEPKLPDAQDIRELARAVGYGIGVHGSFERDLDLIAAPWVEDAVSPRELAEHIAKFLPGRIAAEFEDAPHGRAGFNIKPDGWFRMIDLSVMTPHPAAPSADKLRTGNLWWNADDWETTFADIEDAYEAATGGYGIGVARLGRATEHDAVWAVCIDIDTTGDGEADDREIRLFATEDEARQALAALKAEGEK